MRFVIELAGVPLGYADLEPRARAVGVFVPGDAYVMIRSGVVMRTISSTAPQMRTGAGSRGSRCVGRAGTGALPSSCGLGRPNRYPCA